MLFITASDTGFYFFLPYMVGQIERLFPKARLIVYDLGMTEQETLQLNEWGVEVKKWHIGPGHPVEKPNYFPRALHKPSMILDALERHPNEYVVYLDADAIPNKRFSVPTGCDVAVTMVDQEALTILDSKPEIKYNGIFNTGVVMFGRSKRRLAFASEWSDRLSTSGSIESDQRIAWLLLEEMEGFSRQEYDVTNVLSVRGENVMVRVLRDTEWNLFALRAHFLRGKERIHPDGANVLHFKGHSMHNPADFRNCMKMGKMPLSTKGVPLC